MTTSSGLAAALLLMVSGCSGGAPTTAEVSVVPGLWGGEHIGLTVAPDGATVEFDCAHGTLQAPLTLHNGSFDVHGVLVFEQGGPIRPSEQLVEHGARYSGVVDGSSMTLQVTLVEPPTDVGTYSLRLGATARLFKCL